MLRLKRRKNPERVFQFAVKRFLNVALPVNSFCTAFPAGGGGALRGAILKDMGLVPGCPDILIIYNQRAYWLELKAATGRLSEDQRDTIHRLERAGSPTVVCKTLDDVQDALRAWGIPLRAEVDPRTVSGARMIA